MDELFLFISDSGAAAISQGSDDVEDGKFGKGPRPSGAVKAPYSSQPYSNSDSSTKFKHTWQRTAETLAIVKSHTHKQNSSKIGVK